MYNVKIMRCEVVISIIGAIVSMVVPMLIVLLYLRQVLKNRDVRRNSTQHNENMNTLTHEDCDNSDNTSCLHIDNVYEDNRYGKVCKKCGHRNDKNAKKCSVCSTRLKMF